MTKAGDKIKIEKKDGEIIEGVLMPSEKKGILVIKLDNGYNVGVDEKNIKNKEMIEEFKESKVLKKMAVRVNPKLPTISVLHTGGTIASKVDYRTGGVVARFNPEELLGMFPELGKMCNLKSSLIANMFSEDMRFAHYKVIIDAIKKEIEEGTNGIILTHGTDTLGYTSAALAFALENLPVPVILVGAQRSSDRGSSDAGMNLICAAQFIASKKFKGVAVCMHGSSKDKECVILPACKTRKLHTSRRDAFKVVNDDEIARVGYKTGKVKFVKEIEEVKGNFIVKDGFEEKVGLIKAHPNMFPEDFAYFKGYKGLIIEGTGLGQAPVGVPNELCKIHSKILSEIKRLVDSGTVVIMTSQCVFGRVNMHVYSNAIDLDKAGVISGEDMITETAFIKLTWLLGNFNSNEVKKLVGENLRGEITDRSLYKEDFLE